VHCLQRDRQTKDKYLPAGPVHHGAYLYEAHTIKL
jgi:hypothetical protein